MNQIERRDKGLAYVCDDEAFAQQAECRKILQQLNFMDRSDFDGIKEVVKQLLGKSDEAFINPPFYCDYGFNIEVGKEFFANYNCTIIDVAKVKIGDNCMLPGVTVGSNSVIGAGSVVTRDVPPWSIAAGNPCRVIKTITEADRKKLFKDEEIDAEAWDDIVVNGFGGEG